MSPPQQHFTLKFTPGKILITRFQYPWIHVSQWLFATGSRWIRWPTLYKLDVAHIGISVKLTDGRCRFVKFSTTTVPSFMVGWDTVWADLPIQLLWYACTNVHRTDHDVAQLIIFATVENTIQYAILFIKCSTWILRHIQNRTWHFCFLDSIYFCASTVSSSIPYGTAAKILCRMTPCVCLVNTFQCPK